MKSLGFDENWEDLGNAIILTALKDCRMAVKNIRCYKRRIVKLEEIMGKDDVPEEVYVSSQFTKQKYISNINWYSKTVKEVEDFFGSGRAKKFTTMEHPEVLFEQVKNKLKKEGYEV